jgi:polysaccharide deacetylase 2 family uncharacterized protein YibQ
MRRDELRQPLKKRGLAERLWAARPSALQAASLAAIFVFTAFGVWVARTPYPNAGEPVVTLAIPPAETIKTASIDPPIQQTDAQNAPEDTASVEDSAPESADTEEDTSDNQVVETDASIIVAPRRPLAPAPIAAVTEEGPYGPLPRIGSGNKKSASVYARTTPIGILLSSAPKIAIILGGMGLNDDLTRRAIKDLPGDVSFAFAPYGDNLQPLVDKARAGGHEVLLQLPLEPFGYPATNPGPKTLLVNDQNGANLDDLMWHMGRFAGYVGIINYMGGRFITEPNALRPVLAELKKRGLLFLDDGAANRSMTAEIGNVVGLPVKRAQNVIDAKADPLSIATALASLESEARTSGVAIGTGTGLPVTIDAVSEWAKTLADRGIILIPVSAAYKGRPS